MNTIFVNEDTHFVVINKENYEYFLKKISIDEHQKEIKCILSSKIFLKVNAFIFKQTYYDLFIRYRIAKNEYIVEENVIYDYLYFLKKGEYEITLTMTLIQLNELLKLLGGDEFNMKDVDDLPDCKYSFN